MSLNPSISKMINEYRAAHLPEVDRLRDDVAPFISQVEQLDLWNAAFFKQIIKQQLKFKY